MRWEALFADMEAQLRAATAADLAAEVAELTRAERSTVELVGRLRSARGAQVGVLVAGGSALHGEVLDVASQWVLLGEGATRALVPTRAVVAVRGLPASATPAPGAVPRRLGLGTALRALSRDRVTVRIVTTGAELAGRIDRVGADHLDLAPGVGTDDLGGAVPPWAVSFAALRVIRST